ncbi:hypothetical protein B0H19DRAFT_1200280 [Mycena capillaripes]|nr:hypothetical protein B0H19DRAFT_1200280 [Mycena capillaripes]
MASSRSLSSPEAGPRDQSLDLAEAVSSFFSAHPGAAYVLLFTIPFFIFLLDVVFDSSSFSTLESILDGHWEYVLPFAIPPFTFPFGLVLIHLLSVQLLLWLVRLLLVFLMRVQRVPLYRRVLLPMLPLRPVSPLLPALPLHPPLR